MPHNNPQWIFTELHYVMHFPSGQYGEAAWCVLRLHKTLAEARELGGGPAGEGRGGAVEALQAACNTCEARIGQVWRGSSVGGWTWLRVEG